MSWQKYVHGCLCKTCIQYAFAVLFQLFFLFSCFKWIRLELYFEFDSYFCKQKQTGKICMKIFFCYSAYYLNARNNLKHSGETHRNTIILLRGKTEVQNWAVPFEKDLCWIVQGMSHVISASWPSDCLHHKSTFGQTNLFSCRQYTLLIAFFWLHPKLPSPHISHFLFPARVSKCLCVCWQH